jgi:hypothetical protein
MGLVEETVEDVPRLVVPFTIKDLPIVVVLI